LTSTTPAPFIHSATSTYPTTPQVCTQVTHTANILLPIRQHDDKDSVTCTYPPTQPNPGTCNGRGPRLPRRAPSAVSLGPFVFPFAWVICIRDGARRLGRLGEWLSGFARVCVFQRAPSFPLRHVPARPSLDSRRHLTTLSRDPCSTFFTLCCCCLVALCPALVVI
jgi:hypothetical protein